MSILRVFFIHIRQSLRAARGQTLVEYALILLLIAIVVIVMLGTFGKTVNNTYSEINSSVTDAVGR